MRVVVRLWSDIFQKYMLRNSTVASEAVARTSGVDARGAREELRVPQSCTQHNFREHDSLARLSLVVWFHERRHNILLSVCLLPHNPSTLCFIMLFCRPTASSENTWRNSVAFASPRLSGSQTARELIVSAARVLHCTYRKVQYSTMRCCIMWQLEEEDTRQEDKLLHRVSSIWLVRLDTTIASTRRQLHGLPNGLEQQRVFKAGAGAHTIE